MNNIKFRAWDKITQRMYQVSSIHIEDEYMDLFDKSIYEGEFTRKNGDVILMQFTGLKDKNGVEIFEGDIVNYFGFVYRIIFKDSAFGWIEDDSFIPFAQMCIGEISKTYVLGNIHENPELLNEVE